MEALQTVFATIKEVLNIIMTFLADLGISFEKKDAE